MLDLACGEGTHSIAAAGLGAEVVAVDRDADKLESARALAEQLELAIGWRQFDLEEPWPDLGQFDAILVFNYLDRARIGDLIDRLKWGGSLVMETYLLAQRDLGWGPSRDEFLLRPGELPGLVDPLEVVHCREVLEPVDAQRWRAVASVVAEKR